MHGCSCQTAAHDPYVPRGAGAAWRCAFAGRAWSRWGWRSVGLTRASWVELEGGGDVAGTADTCGSAGARVMEAEVVWHDGCDRAGGGAGRAAEEGRGSLAGAVKLSRRAQGVYY